MVKFFFGVFAALVFATASAAQSSYKVKTGDVLAIEVLEDPNLNRQVLVLPDGNISFPLAGTVPTSGRSIADVKAQITSALASNFAAPPTVFVSVASLGRSSGGSSSGSSSITVYALGAMNGQGKIKITRGTTLLQFLAESGGFTQFAATKRIQLRRRDPQNGQEHVYTFDYNAVTRGGKIPGATTLRQGDVIVVPERRLFE